MTSIESGLTCRLHKQRVRVRCAVFHKHSFHYPVDFYADFFALVFPPSSCLFDQWNKRLQSIQLELVRLAGLGMKLNAVCRVYFSMPKRGMAQQCEVGRKKHMQFHRDQKDTWTWNTFAVETGDNTGTYVTSSCGHTWKDFDEWEARMGKADTADGATNLTPYVQSGRNGFYDDGHFGFLDRCVTPAELNKLMRI